MKLDCNVFGRNKYALVRLRGIAEGSEADQHLQRLQELGQIDFGLPGAPDEFFVIKLRDRYAMAAFVAYALEAIDDDPEYAREVLSLARRAGILSKHRKRPD